MNKWLNIKVSRCLLILTEQEFMKLLGSDPALFSTAIKRGKGLLRSTQTRERVKEKVEREAIQNEKTSLKISNPE